MTDTRDQGTYEVIETFQPEEFRFFRHFHITSSFFAVFSIGLGFVVWVPVAVALLSQSDLGGPVLKAAVFTTAAYLFFAAIAGIGKRGFDETRFIVSLDGIVRRDLFRTVSVAWRDITAVRKRRIPGAKGALEIRSPRSRLLLPSTIAGFGLLCGKIRSGLEQAGRGSLFDGGLLRTMQAMGGMSERWNMRAKRAFWPIIGTTAGTMLFNAFVAWFVWDTGVIALVVWAGITLPLPLLVYSVADIRLNRRVEEALLQGSAVDENRDLAGELALGFLAAAPFYGILGIIARTIFLR